MRKAILTALFLAVCSSAAFAQGEYKKGEVFVGYSANEVDTQGAFSTNPNDNGHDHFNGFNVEATGNFTRYVGVQGDFSFHQKEKDFNTAAGTINARARLSQFMGGVKVQDNATETHIRPFAHALVGVAHVSTDVNATSIGVFTSDSDNGLAVAVGGGLDFRINDKFDVRAIQADYNPTRFNGETDHNLRLSFGVNFRF